MHLSASLFSTPFTIEIQDAGTFLQLGKYEAWVGRTSYVPHKRSAHELAMVASQHRGYFKKSFSRFLSVLHHESVPGVRSWEVYAFGLVVSLDRIELASMASAIEL